LPRIEVLPADGRSKQHGIQWQHGSEQQQVKRDKQPFLRFAGSRSGTPEDIEGHLLSLGKRQNLQAAAEALAYRGSRLVRQPRDKGGRASGASGWLMSCGRDGTIDRVPRPPR